MTPAIHRNRWSDADLETLRTLYPTADLPALANQLGRTVGQLQNKASLMGVPRDAATVRQGRICRPSTMPIRESVMQLARKPGGTRAEDVASDCECSMRRVHAVLENLVRRGELHRARISHRKTLFFTNARAAAALHRYTPINHGAGSPQAAGPAVVIRSTRGPAYLPGEPLITPATRWTIAPPPARTLRSNTHTISG